MIKHISTHALLTQLKQGQDEILDVLYPHYARVFYVYARHHRLSHEDAEDVVQITFWRILDRVASYDEEHGGGEKWMWSICRNLVIDMLRGKVLEALPDEEMLAEDGDPESYIEAQESLLNFAVAWNALEEADRKELRRGRGRGPGRKVWHDALRRLRALYFSRSE